MTPLVDINQDTQDFFNIITSPRVSDILIIYIPTTNTEYSFIDLVLKPNELNAL